MFNGHGSRYAIRPATARERRVAERYGISVHEYRSMVEDQGGVCAICGGVNNVDRVSTALVVDHDHESGQVRGLLCNRCNTGLGMFRDSPSILAAAIEYLDLTTPGGVV